MRKTNKTTSTQSCQITRTGQSRKRVFLVMLLLGMMGTSFAQSHEHEEDDTLMALGKNDFSVSLLQNNASQFQIQIKNNLLDTLQPFFIEMHAIGFNFTDDCILQQSINNLNLETNLEKLWGPQYISLGIGVVPPNGTYNTTLATSSNSSDAMIKVRLFGSINGHHFIWVGYIKK
jgi:hypothetical protein